MADDINPARRTELSDQRMALQPQIRGLHDLRNASVTDELRAEIDARIAVLERRAGFIGAELDLMDQTNAAHDTLVGDGYPTLDNAVIRQDLFDQLQGQIADLQAAAGTFDADQPAAALTIGLGTASPKP